MACFTEQTQPDRTKHYLGGFFGFGIALKRPGVQIPPAPLLRGGRQRDAGPNVDARWPYGKQNLPSCGVFSGLVSKASGALNFSSPCNGAGPAWRRESKTLDRLPGVC